MEEVPALSTDKPARRKKTDSQPKPDPDQPAKPRGRKKIKPETEPIPIIDSEPDLVEYPVVTTESVPQEPESIFEETPVEVPAAEPQPDISDSLWQSWLNRLSSRLAARAKRPTLVQRETAISDLETQSIQSIPISEVTSDPEQNEIQNLPPLDWVSRSEIPVSL